MTTAMLPRPLYYLGNARSERQQQEMIALEKAGVCIFCPEHHVPKGRREVLLEHPGGIAWRKEVLLETDTWVLLVNEYPYDGTLHHVMMVPKKHVTCLHHLSPAGRLGYFEMLDMVVNAYGDAYYGIGIRSGDMRYTGATIAHLHVQFVIADPSHKGERVMLFLSSVPAPDPPSIW